MNSLEKIRKGSFTIEAACVMSLVLLVLMGVLYLSFFVHNRAWLTAAACESAENLTGQVKNGKEIKVTYTADTISGFGGFRWKLTAEGSSRVIRPVEWIRKIRAASEVIEEIGG